MKTWPAIFAALGITAVVAVGMFLIGANALFNPNAGPISNSPGVVQAAASTSSNATSTPAASGAAADAQQVAQLQSLVKQYQGREKQYQTELDQAAQKLNQTNQALSQANQTAQGYQSILEQLQQMGVIQISANGQITVNSLGGRQRSNNNGFFNGDD